MAQPTCATHPESEAVGSCQSCLRTVCGLCVVVDSSRSLCLVCARRARRLRTVTITAITVLACGGVAFLATRPGHKESASAAVPRKTSDFNYGMYREVVEALEGRLEKEPCDRQQMFNLDDTLFKAGDYRSVIDRTEAFWKKCGPFPRLAWLTYSSHKYLSEFDKAIADATKLIDDKPHDKDFWWWRGIAYEEVGQPEKAVSDYRQALTIEPRLTGVPFNLAGLYEKLNRPCEAIFPIEQFLRYHPDVQDRERVEQRLMRLHANPQCASLVGKGKAVLRFTPGDSAIRTSVRIGRVSAIFIVDTGASLTVLSSALANKLDLKGNTKILVHTASGITEARLAVVDDIEVQGVRSTHVPVAVVDNVPPGADGLLGLSFLSRFDLKMESLAGRLTVTARRAPGR